MGAAVAVAGLGFVAVSAVVSVIASVVASIAAVLSSLLWVIGMVGGLGVLGATAAYATREVLEYRAEMRTRLLLAARTPALPPAAPVVSGRVLGGVRLPLVVGREAGR
jgi:hypothetical protein